MVCSSPLGHAAGEDKGDDVGLLDSVKGLLKGNKSTIDKGIDSAAAAVKQKTPDQIDGAVQQGADAAKDAINKLD